MTSLKRYSFLLAAVITIFTFCGRGFAQSRPNIILIMADDMGYSDIGSYGGEVKTPNLDKLASGGVRYKQFYNAARCCPTRAALMTGLYPHQAGMGWMAAADLGTPAYQGTINNTSVTIAEVLKTAGYSTYMTGKWHLTNERKIDGYVTESWPKQRGFDRYFGIVPGGSNFFTPVIYSDNNRYKAPDNFYLTSAISDTSVRYIDEHFKSRPSDPLFMYVAYTAPHWPLHALQKDIDKYKDVYKAGWDKMRAERFKKQKQIGLIPQNAVMSKRDAAVEAWDSLTEEKKDEMAMRMAIYAAQIDVMDQGIGQIVDKLKEKKQLDNTLIFFLSDNGACAEFISSGKSKAVTGQEDTFESYRIEWANLSSTPFKEFKHWTHEGGIASPFIVHWPKGIKPELANKYVNEYGFLTDIMATCLDVSGAVYPKTYKGNAITPLQGKSLLPHFSGKTNNRGIIFWEHEANIAVRDGKWKLVAKTPEGRDLSREALELYDMDADPVEMTDLASKYPERVNSMFAKWNTWANSVGAFPLDTREYNLRAQSYKKRINGTFEDDRLGGWAIKKQGKVQGDISLDESSQIEGKNSVKIGLQQQAEKPAGLGMTWNFVPQQGEKYQIKFSTKSNRNTSYLVRIEKPNGESKLIDFPVKVSEKVTGISSQIFEVPEKGPYQLALYFGKMNGGDQVWVDDVELIQIN